MLISSREHPRTYSDPYVTCLCKNTHKNYGNYYRVNINIEQRSWSAIFRKETFFLSLTEIRVSDSPVLPDE
jgi:ubiquitin-protein ligase